MACSDSKFEPVIIVNNSRVLNVGGTGDAKIYYVHMHAQNM